MVTVWRLPEVDTDMFPSAVPVNRTAILFGLARPKMLPDAPIVLSCQLPDTRLPR
jgi:hypothetical protein